MPGFWFAVNTVAKKQERKKQELEKIRIRKKERKKEKRKKERKSGKLQKRMENKICLHFDVE